MWRITLCSIALAISMALCSGCSGGDLAHRAVERQASGDLNGATACYTEAIAKCRRAIVTKHSQTEDRTKDSEFAQLLVRRAAVYELQGQYERALSDLKEAVALSDRKSEVLLYCGYVCDQIGDEKKAREYYDASLTESPSLDGFMHRADLKRNQKAYGDAITDYNKALLCRTDAVANGGRDVMSANASESVSAPHIYYWRGVCREILSDKSAREDFDNVIAKANQFQSLADEQAAHKREFVFLLPQSLLNTDDLSGMIRHYRGLAYGKLGKEELSRIDLAESRKLNYFPQRYRR